MELKKKKDHWLNHLSEAFENLSGEPKLELEVLTLNINEGHNEELMEQCQILREYAQYVDCVRRYAKEFELIDAIEQAVDECIQRNILSEFLRKNKAEVIAMSIFEYDEKAVRQVYYEDGLQAGRKDGIKTGILNMLKTQKYSLEEISEVFQVPVEEIEQIKKQQI